MNPSGEIVSELRRLFQRSSHYLGGLLASMAIGLISFPVYTRVFSVADYGTIDLAQKIVLFFVAAFKMGQQNSALRFFDPVRFASDREAARSYYTTMFYGMALTGGLGATLFLGGLKIAPSRLLGGSIATVIAFVAVMILLRSLESVLFSFLRIEERTRLYAFALASLKGAGFVAVCVLLVVIGRSVQAYLWGVAVVEAIVIGILTFDLLRRRMLRLPSFDSALFRKGLAFGIPLIVYEAATIVLDSGDRVLVRHYLGADALGRYSVAYGLSTSLNDLLIAPLNLALLPIYMRLWHTGGREKTAEFLSTGLDFLLMASVGLFALTAATTRDAITLLASSKYSGVDRSMSIIIGGLLIYTTQVFLTAGLLIHKKTMVMARLLVYSVAVNIGLNCLLLPRLGFDAAAISTFLSYLFCVILLGRASFRLLPLRLSFAALGKYGLAGAAAWFVASRIAIAPLVFNIAARTLAVVAIYITVLYFVDSRVRMACSFVLRRLRAGTRPCGAVLGSAAVSDN